MNIIIKELPRTLTEKQLLQLFLPFGEVSAHNLVKEAGTGKSKGFGFVEMPDNLQAREAIKALHNRLIEDVRIRVKMISRKYEPTYKKPKAKSEYTGPRFFGAITRTEELGTERPERPRGRGNATSQRSAGSYRPRYERTESQGTDRPARGRGPATSQNPSEGRGSNSSGWTRSRSEAEGGNRTPRYADRNVSRPARTEGSFRPRYEKTEKQGTEKPFRGTGKNIYSDRDAAAPARPAGKYRMRPAKTGAKKASNPAKGPRAAKRGRTPARPIKIGRSGARQSKAPHKGKRY